MDKCTRRINQVSTGVQAACRRVTKSACAVTESRYTKSLKLPYRKEYNGVRPDDLGGHRTVVPNTIPNEESAVQNLDEILLHPAHLRRFNF
ncbi:hypothetical protein TNCV_4405911 [Trichonephila clavipes]|uniref:Uncharacterized protein n=1 Tax=Trichonephila clavipes TaxID=2585209 RepID=A0A8X6S544_TRICX|nr:hypothetical protein TNCV_4405911 [Trichonephila clavipes]